MQNSLKTEKRRESSGEMLRFWRKLNRRSQMDLALDVDISSKHLSFLETGKSRPSRNLALKIAQALKLPLRQQNAFLMAAGHAPEFAEEPFDGQKMAVVREALGRMLEKHEPYPAFVVDTSYTLLMANSGYDRIVKCFAGEKALGKYGNAMRILFAEDGLQPYVRDWPAVELFLLARLWEEAASTQNSALVALVTDISRQRSDPVDAQIDRSLPIMPLVLEKDGTTASFFTLITTLGTPLDLTTQELRLELLFPSDEATKGLFPFESQAAFD